MNSAQRPDNSPPTPTLPRKNAEESGRDPPRKPIPKHARVATGFRSTRSTLPPVNIGESGEPSADLPDESEQSVEAGRRRFTRRSKITAAVLAVVALWVVVSVLMVVVAAEHVHQGEAAVQSARQGLSADGILSGKPVGSLRSAESSFSSAHGLLSSPLLWPVDDELQPV